MCVARSLASSADRSKAIKTIVTLYERIILTMAGRAFISDFNDPARKLAACADGRLRWESRREINRPIKSATVFKSG